MGLLKETGSFGSIDDNSAVSIYIYRFLFKRLLVVRNGGEVSILAFGAGICCKVIFVCLA